MAKRLLTTNAYLAICLYCLLQNDSLVYMLKLNGLQHKQLFIIQF